MSAPIATSDPADWKVEEHKTIPVIRAGDPNPGQAFVILMGFQASKNVSQPGKPVLPVLNVDLSNVDHPMTQWPNDFIITIQALGHWVINIRHISEKIC